MVKRKIVLVISLLAVLVTVAQVKSTNPTFRRKRVWLVASLPLWQPAWTVVHEGSHAGAYALVGNHITSFKPYPHMDERRGFMFGVVRSTCPDGICNRWNKLFGSSAPYILDAGVFVTSDLLLSTGVVEPSSSLGGLLFVGGMLVPFADFVTQMNGIRGIDRQNIADSIGVKPLTVTIAADMLAAVALWRIYVNGRRFFFDVKRTESRIELSPSSSGFGATLTIHW